MHTGYFVYIIPTAGKIQITIPILKGGWRAEVKCFAKFTKLMSEEMWFESKPIFFLKCFIVK